MVAPEGALAIAQRNDPPVRLSVVLRTGLQVSGVDVGVGALVVVGGSRVGVNVDVLIGGGSV